MLFTTKYDEALTPLWPYDALYHVLNISLSVVWLLWLLNSIWYNMYEPDWQGALTFLGVILCFGISCNVVTTYKTVVGQRGLLMPKHFSIGYVVLLVFMLLFSTLGVGYGVSLWLIVILTAAIIRKVVEFKVHQWIGETGTFIRREGWVRRYYQHAIKRNEPSLHWAGMEIPWGEATRNFLLFGAISSGKTISLRLYMQSFVPLVGKGSNTLSDTYTRVSK